MKFIKNKSIISNQSIDAIHLLIYKDIYILFNVMNNNLNNQLIRYLIYLINSNKLNSLKINR